MDFIVNVIISKIQCPGWISGAGKNFKVSTLGFYVSMLEFVLQTQHEAKLRMEL